MSNYIDAMNGKHTDGSEYDDDDLSFAAINRLREDIDYAERELESAQEALWQAEDDVKELKQELIERLEKIKNG